MSLTTSVYFDELVEKCKRGDMQSCKELYYRYSKAMFNTSFRIVNNTSDAEDVLQESFLAAFSHLQDFDHSSAFGAWLKRIVINKSISFLRKQKLAIVDIDTTATELIEEEKPDELDIQLKVESIKKAVSELPNGYRTVLSLSLFEQCSYEEISGMLNISETTVRTQYHRGKQKLLELLKKEVCDERQTETIYK
ncbi:MAG TPA: RNA polymerase sigma factor [Chitinophagaceae bacterium]